MNTNESVYFVGSLFKGSTSVHRLNAVKNICDKVYDLNQQITNNFTILFLDRILSKTIKKNINSRLLNKTILFEVEHIKPEVVWIDKGLQVSPDTLKTIRTKLPTVKIIHNSPDDMMNPANQTRYYISSVPLYDLHVTTKSYNVKELYDLGANKVLFVNNAYAPEVHKPYELADEEKKKYSSDVSFIGGPEEERAESITKIANDGVKIVIWGNGWSKFLNPHPNIIIKKGWFADEEYSKIICGTNINLAFLRKVNRDLQTTRTMEIPACGGFMLAERTEEHLNLFKEDSEAVFFSDDTELKSKIEYYLTNENERKIIAMNGLKRCKESGYDNITMIKKVINTLGYE